MINHTRNFGSQSAFTSGMAVATGDAVVLLDGDLQDPPELIEQFHEQWLEGYDVVYGVRVKRETTLFMRVAYKLFYRVFQRVAYVRVPVDAGDFSLIDRRVVDALNALPENNRFVRGLRAWVGFRQTGVPYVRPERPFGRSTNSLLRNLGWARKAVISFSYAPLDFITFARVRDRRRLDARRRLPKSCSASSIRRCATRLHDAARRRPLSRRDPASLPEHHRRVPRGHLRGGQAPARLHRRQCHPGRARAPRRSRERRSSSAGASRESDGSRGAVTRALVTGAAGFIGANLVRRLLRDGHDVHAVIGPGTDTWRIDGLEISRTSHRPHRPAAVDVLLASVRPGWIFHLAAHGAYSWQVDTRRIVAVDVGGAANLLESALAVGFDAFVNAGSSSEYGVKTAAPSEDEAVDPNSVYAAAKAAATMLLRHASIAHDVPITTLRLYSAYGPWEDQRRLIPSLVMRGLEGGLPPLVDPSVARDFVYVDDVVDAFVRSAEASLPRGTVLNIASGVQTSLADAVEVTQRVFGLDAEPSWGSLPTRIWDTSTWVGDPTRAGELLGWRASRDFEAGFRATVAWAREEGWS